MRFWDTSAPIPLFVAEHSTAKVERQLQEDPEVVVWTLTRVELLSAFARRRRAEPSASRRLAAARREVVSAWDHWSEVTAVEVVLRHAERIVETHPLSAADALQVGAALVAAEGFPATLEFVTLDRKQAVAAEQEGFRVIGP